MWQLKLSLTFCVILKVRELCVTPTCFVLFLQNLFTDGCENDSACTSDDGSASRWPLRAVATLPVSKSLSRFVHSEVPCKAAGQFCLLFTDAANIWKVMTRSTWPGSSPPLFVQAVWWSNSDQPITRGEIFSIPCNLDYMAKNCSPVWVPGMSWLIDLG